MYTGHVAIALGARGVRRDLPLWVAVLAAQAPDWVEVICAGLGARASAQLWSHAFPFVLLGASAAAILVRLRMRSSGAALAAFAVYLSHPLADLVTGSKPLWSGGPPLGLWLIDRPVPDFVVQSSLCVVGWVIYRRSLSPDVRRRVIAAAPLVALLALQGVSDLVVFVRKPFGTTVTAGMGDGRQLGSSNFREASRGKPDGRRHAPSSSPVSRFPLPVGSDARFPIPDSLFPRNYRQRHVRWMRRVVDETLMGHDERAIALVVAAGVQVAIVLREERGRYRHAEPVSRLEHA